MLRLKFLISIYIITILLFSNGSTLKAQKIDQVVDFFRLDWAFKSSQISFSCIDQVSGELVASFQPNLVLIPASSQKLITCIYGLETCGIDFKFTTKIEYIGIIEKGVLKGDLIISGSGDPSLGSDLTWGNGQLEKLREEIIKAIKNKGIKSMTGNIYGDATFLTGEGIYDSWMWYDIGNYYASGVYGLNIFDNAVKISFLQTKEGGYPKIKGVFPDFGDINFKSFVISKGKDDNAYIYGAPFQNNREIRGSIPAGNTIFEIKGSMSNPPLYAAKLLKFWMEKEGLKVGGNGMSSLSLSLPKGIRKNLYTMKSEPLKDIVIQTLLKSLNLNAEAILRISGLVKSQQCNQQCAVEYLNAYVAQELQKKADFFLKDGSGLSPMNAISTLDLASFLHKKLNNPALKPIIESSLCIFGKTGTLKNWGKLPLLLGNVKAKSGSMERVRSLTGIFKGKSGKDYTFSLIVNNYVASNSEIKHKIEIFLEQSILAL